MRQRCMPAAPVDRDADLIGGREHGSGAYRDLARRQAWPIMQRVDLIHWKALEQAFAHHYITATAVLLGRLKDDVRSALERTRLAEIARRAEQHGGMALVSAGVDAPRGLRAVRSL